MRKKLSYRQRVRWFMENYYETGMEYSHLLESMKNEDLDNFEWYGDIIHIPRYKDDKKDIRYILVAVVILAMGATIMWWIVDLVLNIISKSCDIWTLP